MKNFYLLILFLMGARPALAQAVRPSQYCILEAEYKRHNGAGLTLLTGTNPAANQVEEATKVASMAYEVDALNYLSSHGWEVISTTVLNHGPGTIYATRYYLRRTP